MCLWDYTEAIIIIPWAIGGLLGFFSIIIVAPSAPRQSITTSELLFTHVLKIT